MTFQNPIRWPDGWKRGQARPPASSGRFKTTFDKSRRRMFAALEKMGATSVVISSNMPLRLDGTPRADIARRYISDNGVAVYFSLRKKQMVMARDAYDSPFDNFHSLTLALEYLQGLERHGGAAMMERAFEGFAALPAPAGGFKTWREIMRIPPNKPVDAGSLRKQYRYMVTQMHPDTESGSEEAFRQLNQAYADGRRELGIEEAA